MSLPAETKSRHCLLFKVTLLKVTNCLRFLSCEAVLLPVPVQTSYYYTQKKTYFFSQQVKNQTKATDVQVMRVIYFMMQGECTTLPDTIVLNSKMNRPNKPEAKQKQTNKKKVWSNFLDRCHQLWNSVTITSEYHNSALSPPARGDTDTMTTHHYEN